MTAPLARRSFGHVASLCSGRASCRLCASRWRPARTSGRCGQRARSPRAHARPWRRSVSRRNCALGRRGCAAGVRAVHGRRRPSPDRSFRAGRDNASWVGRDQGRYRGGEGRAISHVARGRLRGAGGGDVAHGQHSARSTRRPRSTEASPDSGATPDSAHAPGRPSRTASRGARSEACHQDAYSPSCRRRRNRVDRVTSSAVRRGPGGRRGRMGASLSRRRGPRRRPGVEDLRGARRERLLCRRRAHPMRPRRPSPCVRSRATGRPPRGGHRRDTGDRGRGCAPPRAAPRRLPSTCVVVGARCARGRVVRADRQSPRRHGRHLVQLRRVGPSRAGRHRVVL